MACICVAVASASSTMSLALDMFLGGFSEDSEVGSDPDGRRGIVVAGRRKWLLALSTKSWREM